MTTKVGLTHNIKNLVWHHKMDIGTVFPQSFDISEETGEETKDFKEDFKFAQVISFLKSVVKAQQAFIKKNRDKLILCLTLAERRVFMFSDEMLD